MHDRAACFGSPFINEFANSFAPFKTIVVKNNHTTRYESRPHPLCCVPGRLVYVNVDMCEAKCAVGDPMPRLFGEDTLEDLCLDAKLGG